MLLPSAIAGGIFVLAAREQEIDMNAARIRTRLASGLSFVLLSVAVAGPVSGGGTATGQWHMQQGATAGTAVGDYISDAGGLNTYYSFFFEVPPGLSRFDVDIFDADWGAGGAGEAAAGRDRARNTNFGSTATFSLRDPSGTAQTLNFITSSNTLPAGGDNAWLNLYSTSPVATTPTLLASTTQAAGGGTSVGLNVPGGTAVGDLLIVAIARDLDGVSGGVTAPSGWSTLNQGDCPTATCHLAIFYQVVTTVPASPQTFTWTGGQNAEGAMFTFRGVDTASPFASSPAVATATGSTANPVAPTITTLVGTTRVVRLFAGGPGNLASTPPGGHTEIWDQEDGGNDNNGVLGSGATIAQAAAGATGTATFTSATNRWRAATFALRPVTPYVAAGHWELRIDSGDGDDINALGIRAHDGTSGSGGTEIPVYADSFFSYGVNTEEAGTASTRTYTQYPWFTEGCRIEVNTFDWDSGSTVPAPLLDTGALALSSRTGAFTQTDRPLSTNNAWDNVQLNAFTTSADSTEYGIWTETTSISEYNPAGNSNYGVVYLGDDGLANPPPASQPVVDAFRVYLPTDAGTAPTKPYLEQQLRWSCSGVTPPYGPNPPQVGQTSCFTITVRLVNPTSRQIVFSTPTNIVTATVPGAGVTYRLGGAAVSQGSIVSQPADNGTGNITWNPGTVAAGSTQLLSYFVNVTPVAAGTIVVTATHASGNGTRARYVDETGNTTQTRATYELGPLCELAASTDALTPAVVFGFSAAPSAEGVAVRWETASEVGTSRFELHRLAAGGKEWTRVDDGRLNAERLAFQGSVYRALDRGADASRTLTYLVIEEDARGVRRPHGPFLVAASRQPFERGSALSSVEPRPLPQREVVEEAAIRSSSAVAGLKLGIRRPGLAFVSAAELSSGLGLSSADVASRLRTRGFALSRAGAQVAWLPEEGGTGLFFYGEGVDSPYSAEAVYVLRPGPGLAMSLASGKPPALQPVRSFVSRAVAEQDLLPAMVLATDPESDYWFWQALIASDPGAAQATFPIAAPGALPRAKARLRVALFGASTQIPGDHRASVSLNGTSLGEIVFSGLERYEVDLAVPEGVVRAGENAVEVTALLAPGATQNDFFVDRFDLSYSREVTAEDDVLELSTAGRGTVSVGGFTDPRVLVLDLADARRPVVLKEAAVSPSGSTFGVSFGAGPRGGRYLAVSPAAWKGPQWIRPDFASDLRRADHGADYLVVTPRALLASARALADLRAAQGLSTEVVDLDDVYDEFGGGFPSPHALHDFLAFAWTEWSPRPHYLLLAGNGDFDYRNLLGYGGNLIPPLLVPTAHGLFASDAALADLEGNDGVPDVAIGRLPVRSARELDAVVAKLTAYESAISNPSGTALLVADDAEGGFDFSFDLDVFQGWMPAGFVPERIVLGPGGVAAARAQLFAALGAGADLLLYSGHAGLDRITAEGLLTSADLPVLPPIAESPVVVALTCVLNRFEVPMLSPLGAGLVTQPGAGAVAVWSATGLSTHPSAPRLGRFFLEEAGRAPASRVGDPMLAAQHRFAAEEGVEVLSLYNLLGDPATRLAAPRAALPPPPGPGGDPE